MGRDWQEIRLGDVVQIKHGWPFKSQFFSEELAGKPIVVNIGNFQYTGGFRFDSTTLKEYRDEFPPEYELEPEDILLVMTCQTAGGEILGIPARVPADDRTYLHNQRLGKVVVTEPNSVDSGYLYWVFLWSAFNRHLYTTATGTKILHTSPSRIEAFRWKVPPLPIQRAIAHILGTLDDKIELNRRMNETLEAMARAVFQSWFVDFDPVRANVAGQTPPGLAPHVAALFPDAFEDSELGETPRGWKIGNILDIADLLSGGTPKTSEPDYWEGPIPWASAKDVSQCGETFLIVTERSITQAGLDNSATQIIPALSSVVVARGATTGRMTMFGADIAMNQTCYALRTKYETPRFLYALLRSVMGSLVHAAHGSVFDTITTATFRSSRILLPCPRVARVFEDSTRHLFNRILATLHQSHTLTRLRDALLPKLISGELMVPDAERIVGRSI